MQAYGFDGRTYAINRSGAPVFGWPAFTSCAAIGQPVDAAYVCVPVEAVADAIEDIARAGIKAAVVLTSGYSETGVDGARAQRELAARATALGIHLLGPNCLGFANLVERSAITAIPPRGALLPGGHVSLVCQSGATAAEIVEFTQQQGIALNFFAATGNEAQVAIADVVDYLVDDPATRVIMIFAETIRNTRRFSSAAERAFAARKPIVVLKAGSSEVAASVAKAHTGSLVGDDRVFTAACHKLNVIRVTSLEDLVITAGLLAQTGPLRAGGVGIASISGGACTLIGDQAEASGLPLPAFAPATIEKLRGVLPGYAATLNPLDVTGAAVRDPGLFEKAMAILGEDPGIAIRLCVLNLPYLDGMTTPTPQMFAAVGRGLSAGPTPGLLTVQTLKPVSDVSRRIMKENGIPGVTGGLDHTVRAAARAIWWSARVRAASAMIADATATSSAAPDTNAAGAADTASGTRAAPGATTANATGTAAAAKTARAAPKAAHFPSTERAVLDYLSTFNVPVIPSEITSTPDEAVQCARRFGGRVVLKIASPDITHKTDVGGVRLRLEGDAEVSDAWMQINFAVRKAMPQARIDGISVSPMRETGIELLVGTTRDPDWGMVIAVGLGGIWVEALQDTAVRLLPVERADVVEMLTSLRAAKVLQGFRGTPAADLQAIADVVVNIGAAALALGPDAQSLEINPLLVTGSRVEALDGLVVWSESAVAGSK
jgi:acyl-CoA synthetase (NDP forming)